MSTLLFHASTVPRLHVSQMSRTTSPSVHRLYCSDQICRSRAHRSGMVVSFPTCCMEVCTRVSRISRGLLLLSLEVPNLVLRVRLSGACACPFFCAVRFFTVWGGSDTIGPRVRSSAAASPLRSRSVKKSASVVAKGFRPGGHGLDVLLERFSFLKGVLDGTAVNRIGPRGLFAFLLVWAPCLRLPLTCLGESLHGLIGGSAFYL